MLARDQTPPPNTLPNMSRRFSVREARALLPGVHEHAARIVAVRADLAELGAALQAESPSPLGGLPELKSLEARLSEELGWFAASGIEVKGIAPLIIDFPSEREGAPVLLCWLENEPELAWWHSPALGFLGRRRLPG